MGCCASKPPAGDTQSNPISSLMSEPDLKSNQRTHPINCQGKGEKFVTYKAPLNMRFVSANVFQLRYTGNATVNHFDTIPAGSKVDESNADETSDSYSGDR